MFVKKRVSAHTVEVILSVLIALFCLAAGYIFVKAMTMPEQSLFHVIVIMLILVIVGLLGVILVLVRIWEKLPAPKTK